MSDELVKQLLEELNALRDKLYAQRADACPNGDSQCGCSDYPELVSEIGILLQRIADIACPNRDAQCRCWEY